MTAKDKAESLASVMYDVDLWDNEDGLTMQYPHAIKCALIAVNEILLTCVESMIYYWQEVKQELEKL